VVSTFLQGDDGTFTAQFYEYAGGPATNLTGVTVEITKVGEVVPAVPATASGVTNPATGFYTFVWAVPLGQDTGDYTIVWEGTDGQSEIIQASEVFTVGAAVSGTWATVADVLEITGETVTSAKLRQAQYVIDMKSGRSYEIHDMLVANSRRRDLHYLKLATAYQAAWMKSQPDMFGRMNLTNVNADSSSATFGVDAMSLGPLARGALKRVSWQGTRSLRVKKDPASVIPYMSGQRIPPAGSPIYDQPYDGWSQM